MIIAVTEAEREFCKEAADAREQENIGVRNVRGFDNPYYNLTSQQQSRLAVMAEGAVFKWLGGDILNHSIEDWAHFVKKEEYGGTIKKVPDLFGWVEVRRANKQDNGICLRKKDLQVPGTRVVQAYVPYEQAKKLGPIKVGYNVHLIGWCIPEVDYETAKPQKRDSYRYVSNKRPMHDWSLELIAA